VNFQWQLTTYRLSPDAVEAMQVACRQNLRRRRPETVVLVASVVAEGRWAFYRLTAAPFHLTFSAAGPPSSLLIAVSHFISPNHISSYIIRHCKQSHHAYVWHRPTAVRACQKDTLNCAKLFCMKVLLALDLLGL